MHTFMWITLYLAILLIASVITIHVWATDEGLAIIRTRLRRTGGRTNTTRKDSNDETAS